MTTVETLTGEGEPCLEVVADITQSFTYASFQNAVPVIRAIHIHNRTAQAFSELRLELASNPAFFTPKVWTIDRLLPGDDLPVSDRRIDLDPAYLAGLNEAERGILTLTLSSGEDILYRHEQDVRLLARDEWGGVADMVQLLPAFVMPNDPGVAKVLKAAADRLAAGGHASGMDGYQSRDPRRAFMLAGAIYSAITGLSLHYAEPPASFEGRGQKVRRPSLLIADQLATCLDTSLLFAASLEAAGLHPVVLLFEGHAAVGVWLVKRNLANTVETDLMELRKAVASRELLVFETTGVTHRPPMSLAQAGEQLAHRLDQAQATGFVAALDIQRARSGGITPLASHEAANAAPAQPTGAGGLSLPQMPGAGDLPEEVADIKPTTAAGRIDRWQKKLLDLTLRNRLLNFPDSKKTIPFLCTDVPDLEDRLSAGKPIHLISLPEQNPLGQRDASLYRDVHGHDLHRGFAADALLRNELSSPLTAKELEARLIELYRQTRNDLSESGTNTLFLAVGFLRWKKKPEDERIYRAPLLLVPVKLERKSASSRFTLKYHEDEPRINATLLQFLEREFDLKLPQFAGDLPKDESGIDVPRLLGLMRQAVRNVKGMEVVDDTALSTFSFAKFLMWKDLVDRTDALRRNRVVRHLIDTPEKVFDVGGGFREPRDLDLCAPSEIISLLPADSSQTAASMAAAEGRDFVIIGPPGTGKSQTIANMIANCLAAGKTVLFVAEKTAALDVVYRRLREHGLGDHCLELHSNKSDRRHLLHQLRKSWEAGRGTPSDWISINEKLRVRRDELNAYVGALHRTYRNGLTPFEAMGLSLKSAGAHSAVLSWPDLEAHDEAERLALADLAAELGRIYQATGRHEALHALDVETWSSAWQENLLGTAQILRDAALRLLGAHNALLKALGLPQVEDAALTDITRLNALAVILRDNAGKDLRIVFERGFEGLRPALGTLETALHDYEKAEAGLSVPYARDSVMEVPVDDLQPQWTKAAAAIWPLSWLKQKAVRKQMAAYADGRLPDPQTDLALLRRMQGLRQSIEASPLATRVVPYAGLDTSVAAVDQHLNMAEQVRNCVRRFDEQAQTVVAAIRPALTGTQIHPLFGLSADFAQTCAAYAEALRRFSQSANISLSDRHKETALAGVAREMGELIAARGLLRDWTLWCGLRNRARNRGLAPLIADLESGLIAPQDMAQAFHVAYARWWLPPTLDRDPVLRDFHRFQHEHSIDDFRQLDDLVRAQASAHVVSKLAHGLPIAQNVPKNSELGLLRHQMELTRPSQTIRQMIGAMPTTFSKLAPCMLMSPLSIAQYLPPEQALFDVVIFDEASQITTWDAVGAIARGHQTIIVGDPKQLPPTNFFGRNDGGDGADGTPHYEQDLESILDEVKASGIPVRDLRWHYRSRSESLIAFSNHYYYQNRLITFPSPVVDDRAVQLRKVPDGVYDRGKSRTNPMEARTVVNEAVRRMRQWLDLPEKARPTLGIITFNAQQQSLISDLLDEARRDRPELEWYFSDDRTEATIVKNLENVQGDERDVILFSITFWKDAAGKTSMDFGALNREGGERRLNVAVTRARQELIVFSGFTADQIDIARTKATGVHHLKAFLDYAERGAIALPAQDHGSVGGVDSPFEAAVIEALEAKGWQTIPQVGVSGFRIDIGIRHPDRPGAYLAGIECDGATYHSAATARDRDKVREQVLCGLGWCILRVWSTDWWFDKAGAISRLHEALTKSLEEHRTADIQPEPEAPTNWDMGQVVEAQPQHDPTTEPVFEALPVAQAQSHDGLFRDASRAAELGRALYRISDFSDLNPVPERFYDFDYRHTLKAMIERVIETEAPVRTDILAQRIARAHGWLRTGGRIRERIEVFLRDADKTLESSGEFIWAKGTVRDIIDYRQGTDVDSRRGIPEIAIAELASLVRANPDLLFTTDPVLELARLVGVERLTASSRARLDEALSHAAGAPDLHENEKLEL